MAWYVNSWSRGVTTSNPRSQRSKTDRGRVFVRGGKFGFPLIYSSRSTCNSCASLEAWDRAGWEFSNGLWKRMIGFSPREAHNDTSYYQQRTQRLTFLDINDNSESTSDRHDALYRTWKDSGVFVVNTMLSIGLKSRFNSTSDRTTGRIGELLIFEMVLLSTPETKKICAAA
jgi:hypothetical protein